MNPWKKWFSPNTGAGIAAPGPASAVEPLMTELRAARADLQYMRSELDNLRKMMVYSSLDPLLLERLVHRPEIPPQLLDDARNRFGYDYAANRRIRVWHADAISRLLASSHNSLTYDELLDFHQENLERADGTEFAPEAMANLLRAQFIGHVSVTPAGKMVDLFKRFEAVPENHLPQFRDIWLKYAATLLELGRRGDARKIIMRHGDRDRGGIIRLLPLAYFVHTEGLYEKRSPTGKDKAFLADVAESSRIWEYFNRANQPSLEELFRGRNIAVVGNGPQEVGRGLGSEIDAHEIVIRFNDFKIVDQGKDYGKKVDFLITNTDFFSISAIPGLLGVMHRNPLDRCALKAGDAPRRHLLEAVNNGIPLRYYDGGAREWMEKAYSALPVRPRIRMPSSGFYALLIIKTINPEFTLDHVYGFSCKEAMHPIRYVHSHNDFQRVERRDLHDMRQEREVILSLFAKR